MADGNSIINLGDLAKPATTLIEKISSATGILYEPRRIRKKAEAEADAAIIKAKTQIEITDLQQRGLQRLIAEEGRRQENIESVISKALPEVEGSASPENIENDWIANFFDKCKNISDEDMQVLWSKILSGEANRPGKFSKRTISLVADLGKSDAKIFSDLCRYVWTFAGEESIPFVFDHTNTIYKNNEINFENLTHLENLGFINFCPDPSLGYLVRQISYSIVYKKRGFLPVANNPNEKSFKIGQVLFTKAGAELESICDVPSVDGFVEYAQQEMRKNGFELEEVAGTPDPLGLIETVGGEKTDTTDCLCCEKGMPAKLPRQCPVCEHVFQGNGWDGIDAHWRANHEDIMRYEKFWASLCKEHKG